MSEVAAGDVNADGPAYRRHDTSMSSIGNIRRETGAAPGETSESANLNLSKTNIDREAGPGSEGGGNERRIVGKATESPGPAEPGTGPAEPGHGPAQPG